MKDLISVVVPVYNVADYLPACLDSILSQDYKNLEVLLIDDGSTDPSGAICDAYAKQDSRVRAIHQKNGGAAAAKNAALRLASGEYLSFVDSDDFLEPGAYRHMADLLKKTGADIVQCAFRYVSPGGAENMVCHPDGEVLTGMDYLRRLPYDWTSALLWDKLYRRDLFQGVFFEEGHKIDDEFFTYRGFLNAKAVALDGHIVYNYRRRASSVMLSPKASDQRAVDRVQALCRRRKTVLARYPELRKVYDTQFLDALVYMSQYPDNCAESLALSKKAMRAYLLETGNTFPPRRFWRGMVRLLLTGTPALLRGCAAKEAPAQPGDFFP